MRGTAACSLPMGGVSLSLWACGLVAPSLLVPSFPCRSLSFVSLSLVPSLLRLDSAGLGAPAAIGASLDYGSTPNRGKTAQNRLKRGKNKEFFEGVWCFLGIFGHSKGAKTNKFLNLGLARWANSGCVPCGSRGLFGGWSGLVWGFRSHSPPAYENSRFPPLWCNRFLASVQ